MGERQDLVDRISRALIASSNVAIHASPGAGKTWVADAVGDKLVQHGIELVRLDLTTRSSGLAVLTALLREVTGESEVRDDPAAGSTSIHGVWHALTKALAKGQQPIVVILDQFDAVLGYPDALDFLKLARELVHRPRATYCSALFVSRRSLEAIEARVRGISTLASVCFSEYLGAVTDDDLLDLWPAASGLAAEQRRGCLEWSAGHSTLVQYWLFARPDVRPSDGADHQQSEVMQRLVSYLDMLGLLNASAQLVLGPVVDDWLRERRQLISLGVIKRDGHDNRMTLSEHEAFREALRMQTWDLNPWGLLGAAEVRVRGLVESVMTHSHGPDWAEEACRGSAGLTRVFKDASVKRQQDVRQYGRASNWLAYTYPQDLWVLISAHWDEFQPIFRGGDKNLWKARFEGLARYRTPIAHNRPESLSSEQRLQCRVYSEEILRRIDDYELATSGA